MNPVDSTASPPAPQGPGEGTQYLRSDLEFRARVQEICNKIYAAKNLDEILYSLRDEITALLDAERLTIYVIDGQKRELVSRLKSGSEVAEIRIPVTTASIAGCAAQKQMLINIRDVYDPQELTAIDPDLKFDRSWDQQTGYTTRQMLAAPIIFKKFLLGVIQVINRKDEQEAFVKSDEWAVDELAKTMGIALYNQKRMVAKPRASRFGYLLENHLITLKELERAGHEARHRRVPLESVLLKDFKVPKRDLLKSLAQFYKLPFVEYASNTPIPGELLTGIKAGFMRNNVWVPLRTDEDGTVVVAIDNPDDLQRIDEIKTLFPGRRLGLCIAFKQDILELIRLFTQDEKELEGMEKILSQLQDEANEIEDAEAAIGEEDSAVVKLVNKMILDADARGASDIHIEPFLGKENTQVRMRVDGVCQLYQTIPYAYRNAIISRIKIMADLDIAERRKPQDGKIRFKKYGGKDIELRVATMPTQGGLEDAVLRILPAGDPLPLDKIGFSQRNFDHFVQMVTQPYGIIFVCGPTGSGKTTTLHSALHYINRVETKIWTAEDPVEITQRGLRQVQVNPRIGLDFAASLRSFLRADPDVIMVGEMRDQETTSIGIEASLTGHLVLSTLHTNSAPESITRLLDMGMDPFNFADAILCILAQRLVRTLCRNCKRAYHPSREEYDELVREYGAERFAANVNLPYASDLSLYKPVGCEVCNNTGYMGRMGIHELLMGTDALKRLIQVKAPMEQIRDQAMRDGMTSLKQDGIEKIFSGHTDLLQVRKVCIK
jgi:type II secretory ATPase GspE/PulE/Tfp pilus assembly ATPase PilB-like protein